MHAGVLSYKPLGEIGKNFNINCNYMCSKRNICECVIAYMCVCADGIYFGIDAGMIGSAAPVQERHHDDDVDDDYDSTPPTILNSHGRPFYIIHTHTLLPFITHILSTLYFVTVTYEHVYNFYFFEFFFFNNSLKFIVSRLI